MSLSQEIFTLILKLILIKKDDKAAADLAKEVVDTVTSEGAQLFKTNIASFIDEVTKNKKDNQSASITVVLFS